MWAVGINQSSAILFATPISEGGYGFGDRSLGFIYFTPLVAVAIGEGFGHIFNDYLLARYVRTHGGTSEPEARLPSNYIAAVFMIPGIVLVGQALSKYLHYVAVVMGWGMFIFGCMVAISSNNCLHARLISNQSRRSIWVDQSISDSGWLCRTVLPDVLGCR
jgi:hypothetical protein